MSDWTDFVNAPKGVIVAAAGHGKTYAIGSKCRSRVNSKKDR